MIKKIINSKDMNVGQNGFFTQLSGQKPCGYHSHTYYEIFYVYEGQILHYVNKVKEKLNFGDLVILRPSDMHRFQEYEKYNGMKRDLIYKKNQFEKACKYVSPDLLSQINSTVNPVHLRLSAADINAIEDSVSKIQTTLKTDAMKSVALANILLIEILRKYIETTLADANNYPQWIQQLISDMNKIQYFYEPIDVYIEKYHYSKAYMSRTFKNFVGISINAFYLNVRLTYAETLLKTTNKTIAEISKLCGFHNRTYFHRAFLKKYNKTPAHLRKNK